MVNYGEPQPVRFYTWLFIFCDLFYRPFVQIGHAKRGFPSMEAEEHNGGVRTYEARTGIRRHSQLVTNISG